MDPYIYSTFRVTVGDTCSRTRLTMVKVVRQYWQVIVFLPGDRSISKGLLDSSIPVNFGGIFARKNKQTGNSTHIPYHTRANLANSMLNSPSVPHYYVMHVTAR